MRSLVFLAIIINLNCQVCAQVVRFPLINDYTAVGSCSRNFADALSANHNPALLAIVSGGVGIYSERKYSLKELSSHQLAFSWSGKAGGVGLKVQYAGHSLFNQAITSLGYGKKLGELVQLGIQLNYHSVQVAGYGKEGSVTASVGTLWQLTSSLFLGIELMNSLGGKINKSVNEKWASVYKAGLGYEVSELVFIQLQMVKEEKQPMQVVASLQYRLAQQFFIRSVINSASSNIAVGVGWGWQNMRLEVTASRHSQLGITPGLLLLFSRKHNNKAINDITQ